MTFEKEFYCFQSINNIMHHIIYFYSWFCNKFQRWPQFFAIHTWYIVEGKWFHPSKCVNIGQINYWEWILTTDTFVFKYKCYTTIEWKHEPNHQSCTRNMGVTSRHHSPTKIKSFIFAPYSNGRERSFKSEFLIGLAISNKKTAMFIETNKLLHPRLRLKSIREFYGTRC